ncbi:hypothetical protein F5878DRAFT_631666 [Lentinula raphanica]|uniref:Uncharacterized protein n=1 Tax=Lentinula raphanica TaxID=153919 RepID=A0AA38P0C7_9AGAR|nr:hypothetical protein F5878DRAFT_631666 [Lentinula raphanica]
MTLTALVMLSLGPLKIRAWDARSVVKLSIHDTSGIEISLNTAQPIDKWAYRSSEVIPYKNWKSISIRTER